MSPSDRSVAMQEKTLDYVNAGARRVWIVDAEARTVTVSRSDGSALLLQGADTLDGRDVLPWFSLPLEELSEAAC